MCSSPTSCAQLKKVLTTALEKLEKPDTSQLALTTITIDDALPKKLVEMLKAHPKTRDANGAKEVNLVLLGNVTSLASIELARRSQVSNVFVTDPIVVFHENRTRDDNKFRYEPVPFSGQTIQLDLLCTVTRSQITCDARRTENPHLGVTDFAAQLNALCSLMFPTRTDLIATTTANDFERHSKGTVLCLQLQFNADTKDLNNITRTTTMDDDFVDALLEKLFALLYDSNSPVHFRGKRWERVYLAVRNLNSSKLYSMASMKSVSQTVIDSTIRRSLQQLGYTEIPITFATNQPTDVFLWNHVDNTEPHGTIKMARILSRMSGLRDALSTWEKLHSILTIYEPGLVEDLTTTSTGTPRLVQYFVVDPTSSDDERKLEKLFFENQGVEWVCHNEANNVSFIQSSEMQNGILNTLPVCLERMRQFNSTWKFKRLIRPILFPGSLQKPGDKYRGVIRSHILIKHESGQQSASVVFLSQNFKLVLSNLPWDECETKVDNVIDVTKCYDTSIIRYGAQEGIDHIYDQKGFFEHNILPQLNTIIDVVTKALKSVQARSTLCENAASPHFLHCFDVVTIDSELDGVGKHTTFKDGRIIPNLMISSVTTSKAANTFEGRNISQMVLEIINKAMDNSTRAPTPPPALHPPTVVRNMAKPTWQSNFENLAIETLLESDLEKENLGTEHSVKEDAERGDSEGEAEKHEAKPEADEIEGDSKEEGKTHEAKQKAHEGEGESKEEGEKNEAKQQVHRVKGDSEKDGVKDTLSLAPTKASADENANKGENAVQEKQKRRSRRLRAS